MKNLKNKGLWLLLVGLVLTTTKQVATLLGYPIPDPTLNEIANIATTIINALAILGILSDPPTKNDKQDSSSK